MCFRRLIHIVLAAVLGITIMSCGLHLGEKPPPPLSPSFSGNGYDCVGEIPEHLKLYFNDQLSEAQITSFVRCLQRSFTTFARLTRGRDQATYSPDEIRSFLEGYFVKDRHISDELLDEFMLIKQQLVGGETDRITRPELNTLIDVLEDMRLEGIRLKPHISVLNVNLALKQNPANLGVRLERAGEALDQTIATFAGRLQKSPADYSFDHMRRFLDRFRDFVEWKKVNPDSVEAANWVNMLAAFKSATVSPRNKLVVRTTEWTPLLRSLSSWYLVYLRYQIGVKDRSKFFGPGLQNTIFLAKQIFDLLEDAIQEHQPAHVLTFEQMAALATSAQGLHWIPANVGISSLNSAFVATVSKLFGDPRVPPWRRGGETGLEMEALNRMRTDFSSWARTQVHIENAFGMSTAPSQVPNLGQATPMVPTPVLDQLAQPHSADWLEFLKLQTELRRPLFSETRSGSYIYLVKPPQFESYGLSYGLYNLSALNLLRTLVTAVFRGYAQDGINSDGYRTGIRSWEMQRFYEDFRSLGIDVGIMDSRTTTAGSRAFIEGNVFTYSANGIQPEVEPKCDEDHTDARTLDERLASEMTFPEAMEYFAFLYSGGNLATQIYTQLLALSPSDCAREPFFKPSGERVDNPGPEYADVLNPPRVSRSCVSKYLPMILAKTGENMPGLQDFLTRVDAKTASAFVDNMIQASRASYSDNNWVEYSEISVVAVVTQYEETLMTRYDLNSDDLLESNELFTLPPPVDWSGTVNVPPVPGKGCSDATCSNKAWIRTPKPKPTTPPEPTAEDVFAGFIQHYSSEIAGTTLSEADSRGAFRYIVSNKAVPPGGLIGLGEVNLYWYYPSSPTLNRESLSEIFRLIIGRLINAPASSNTPTNPAAADCR